MTSSMYRNGTPSRSKNCRDTTVLLGRSAQAQTKVASPPKQNEDNTLLLGIDSCVNESPGQYEMTTSI